jgi:hypothetical protein
LGIGRKRIGGHLTDQLALIFYVERKDDAGEPVPSMISFTPSGFARPVSLLTDVVETPPAEPDY